MARQFGLLLKAFADGQTVRWEDGSHGQSVNMIFRRSTSQPSTPSSSSGVPSGWFDNVGLVAGTGLLWSSVGTRTSPTANWTWQVPIQVEGIQGIQGPKGDNGESTYFHVRYSQNANGNPMTTVAANAKYLGLLYTSPTAPVDYASTLGLIKGTMGKKGYGEKEQMSHLYLHIVFHTCATFTLTTEKLQKDGSTDLYNDSTTFGDYMD